MFLENIFFNQDISIWNVSNAKNMKIMFFNNTIFNQDLSNWDISNVDINEMLFLTDNNNNKGKCLSWTKEKLDEALRNKSKIQLCSATATPK